MALLFILGQARPKFDLLSSKCLGQQCKAYYLVILFSQASPVNRQPVKVGLCGEPDEAVAGWGFSSGKSA